jgi:hypothetical protein
MLALLSIPRPQQGRPLPALRDGGGTVRDDIMSSEVSADRQQQKVTEFMRLLPLTLEIAGLPHAEPGRHFNEGQMEVRANTLKLAYKIARQIILDVAK